MAFCTNCGAKIEDNMRFCPKCGAPVEERPPKASPAPKPAPPAATPTSASAQEKVLSMLKRNYKVIAIAALAVVILLLLLSRCSGGGKGGDTGTGAGGKKEQFLDQIQGYWAMETQVYGACPAYVNRPWNIGITKNAVQLGEKQGTCPMSEAEYKDDALYFSAQWYQSTPVNGQEPGIEDFDLRLAYDKNGDLLILAVKISDQWASMGEYTRTD